MQAIKSKESIVYFQEETYKQLNEYIAQSNHSSIFILVDTNTHQNCLPYFMGQLETNLPIEVIEFEAGEINKHIETCTGVWNALAELGADRKSLMINLGGGVVTDLGGFVACTYKRGISYINIPTSLLAMVDASVGGKTGVDLGNLKNMVGVISESEMVLVDTTYLQTLPSNELRSGFAEMLKHGLIKDKDYWQRLSQIDALTTDDLAGLIYESVVIKNNIVTVDPTEQNIRKFLNWGHTLGHAIESYFLTHPERTTLLHGEAIAIGMIVEGYLAHKLTGLSEVELKEVSTVLTKIYPKITIEKQDYQPIKDLLIFDKKNEAGKILFVLLTEIGAAQFNCEVPSELIEASLDYYNAL